MSLLINLILPLVSRRGASGRSYPGSTARLGRLESRLVRMSWGSKGDQV